MRRYLLSAVSAIAVMGGASVALAGPMQTLDFNGFTHGTDLSNFGAFSVGGGINVTVTDSENGTGFENAFIFDTQNGSTPDDDDLQGDFEEVDSAGDVIGNGIDLGNVLVLGTASGTCPSTACSVNDTNTTGTIFFTFSVPVSFLAFKAVDTGDSNGVQVQYFDAGNNSLAGPVTLGMAPGDNQFETVSFAATGATISSFAFTGSGGIDDITFQQIPVPATFGFLAFGAILLGAAVGRKRSVNAS